MTNCFKKLQSYREIQRQTRLQVGDYEVFLRILVEELSQNKLSILVSSDGYQRAFMRLERYQQELDLSPEQFQALMDTREKYDNQQFASICNIENSVCQVGKTNDHLCSLIHACLTADVIITGCQQDMMPKMVANFCDKNNSPVVIVLYRGRRRRFVKVPLFQYKEWFVFIDLDHPDINTVIQQPGAFIGPHLLKPTVL